MVTTSTPAALTASKADAGARKWYCFGSGRPRSVTAVSRLTIATSAADRVDVIGPKAVAGFVSRAAVRSVKCTSPANARVTSGGTDGDGDAADDTVAGTNRASPGAADVHPPSAATIEMITKDTRSLTAATVRVRRRYDGPPRPRGDDSRSGRGHDRRHDRGDRTDEAVR